MQCNENTAHARDTTHVSRRACILDQRWRGFLQQSRHREGELGRHGRYVEVESSPSWDRAYMRRCMCLSVCVHACTHVCACACVRMIVCMRVCVVRGCACVCARADVFVIVMSKVSGVTFM